MPTFIGYAHDSLLETSDSSGGFLPGMDINAVDSGNRHLILWGAQGVGAGTAADWGWLQLQIDSVTAYEGFPLSGIPETFRAINEYGLGGSNHTGHAAAWLEAVTTDIKVAWDVDSSGILRGKNIQMQMWDIEDIADDTTQFVLGTQEWVDTAFTGSYVDYASVTVTPNEAGEEWIILGTLGWDAGGNIDVNARLVDSADSVYGESYIYSSVNGSNQENLNLFMGIWVAPDTSSETFSIEALANSGSYSASSMMAVRLKSLSTNYAYVGEGGGLADFTTTVATSTDEKPTGASVTFTPTGDNPVLLWATAQNDAAANKYYNMWFTDDANVSKIPSDAYGTGLPAGAASWDNNGIGYLAAFGHVATPAAASTTYDLYGVSSAVGSSIENITFLAMEADGGDGGPGAAGGGGGGAWASLSGYYYD